MTGADETKRVTRLINQFLDPLNLRLPHRWRSMGNYEHKICWRHTRHMAFAWIAAFGSFMVGIAPASAQQVSGDASATVEVPLTITKVADMRFGDIAPGTGASIARMINNGSITMQGTAVHLGGAFGQAAFEVTGPPNRWITFNFGAPSIVLTNDSGDTITVERFKVFGYQRLSTAGNRLIRASADLLVAANQSPGSYVGEFDVIIDFQ